MKQTLAEHEDYLITLHLAENSANRPLVITFGGQPSGKTPNGFGTNFLLKNGYDNIYVAQKAGTQYQGLSVEAFLDAVTDQCTGRDVVCYGASLGAYTALYYGGSVDARIIAAAPKQSAWPQLQHPEYDNFRFLHKELWEVPRSSKKPVVIYDIHLRYDTMVVDQMVLRAYPDARLIRLEHTGHLVLKAIQKAGQLTSFLLHLIDNDKVMPFELPTEDCPQWTLGRGKALMRSNPQEAMRLLELSFCLQPRRAAYENLLNLLLREDMVNEARDLIARSKKCTDDTYSVSKGIAQLAEKKGVAI